MIRSHGHHTKSQMLMSNLHCGTSKTKAGPGGLVRVALIILEVSLCNLLISMCDFVPCEPIVQRGYRYLSMQF